MAYDSLLIYRACFNIIQALHRLLNSVNSIVIPTHCFIFKECHDGQFGPECESVCHCADQAPCNKTSGLCPNGNCEPGWDPVTCSERKCHLIMFTVLEKALFFLRKMHPYMILYSLKKFLFNDNIIRGVI